MRIVSADISFMRSSLRACLVVCGVEFFLGWVGAWTVCVWVAEGASVCGLASVWAGLRVLSMLL